MKICRDCKHHEIVGSGKYIMDNYCTVKVVNKINVVTGKKERENLDFCSFMREEFGDCKPEGKLWEPINVTEQKVEPQKKSGFFSWLKD